MAPFDFRPMMYRVPTLALQKDIKELFKDAMREAQCFSSCLSCARFNEEEETCKAAFGKRPPARIIAFGCEQYVEVPEDELEP